MNKKKKHLNTCEAQVHRQQCEDAAAFTLFHILGGTTRLLVLQPHVGGGRVGTAAQMLFPHGAPPDLIA